MWNRVFRRNLEQLQEEYRDLHIDLYLPHQVKSIRKYDLIVAALPDDRDKQWDRVWTLLSGCDQSTDVYAFQYPRSRKELAEKASNLKVRWIAEKAQQLPDWLRKTLILQEQRVQTSTSKPIKRLPKQNRCDQDSDKSFRYCLSRILDELKPITDGRGQFESEEGRHLTSLKASSFEALDEKRAESTDIGLCVRTAFLTIWLPRWKADKRKGYWNSVLPTVTSAYRVRVAVPASLMVGILVIFMHYCTKRVGPNGVRLTVQKGCVEVRAKVSRKLTSDHELVKSLKYMCNLFRGSLRVHGKGLIVLTLERESSHTRKGYTP